ncbi:MAG: DUF4388 domain-containing protein [Anaerolineae bacterium]|jgi:DNA-binding PadR family transcriptional regulator
MSAPATTKIDLLLLGLLLDRPMHGYELYQQIQSEGIDTWFNVSAAGVYYSLGKLHDHDLVAESRQQGGRSSRKSIYRLTEKGRTAFFAAMDTHLVSQEDLQLDYDLVVFLLNRVPMRRALPRLEQHQAHLAHQAREVETLWVALRENGRSPLKEAILDHRRRFLEMEQAWLADVIEGIQDIQGLSLQGDLREYHLPDLLRFIISGQHNGTLTVTDGADSRILVFEEGKLICGMYQRRGEAPLTSVEAEQVKQGLCELFCWQSGRFTFEQGKDCPEEAVPIECSAEDLILQGCRQVDNWSIIQRLVPSAGTIFEPGSAAQRSEALGLNAVEQRVMLAVDGIKDVASIARDLDMTLFETSRVFYCLVTIGVLRAADPDKINLRRVFREIAELMCNRTMAWRTTPEDRSCEEEVNARCSHLPIRIRNGRVEDLVDPQLNLDELVEMYVFFLRQQYQVVSSFFGRSNAQQAFEQSLRQLSPELQEMAKRHGLDRVARD